MNALWAAGRPRRKRFLHAPAYLPVLLAVLLLAACGGQSSLAEAEDILISGPTAENITPNSATVLAVSDIDLVCAIAYGTTTDYGQIATDSDMAGVGHSDHHPLLVGLQPDTLYHYRLGGLGPDGTVYRSRDYTFRTPPADTGALQQPGGDNLALFSKGARVVGTSSNFGGGDNASTWGANNAIDGDPQTQWSSDGDSNDAWIEIELPAETHVTSLRFWTRTMGSSAQISSFRVVTDRGEVAGPFTLDDATSLHTFTTDLTAKRLRFEVTDSSGGNTGAVEIEIYGDPEG